MSPNQENFLNLISSSKVCVMVAPAFIVDFKYPAIVGMLKKLGADIVTDLTLGCKIVNDTYVEYIKTHPEQKYFISTPCPIVVSLIKNQYKELSQYLMPIASPMVAQARVLKKNYPDHNIMFIAPCKAKQNIEMKHCKELSETITFKELSEIFVSKNINEEDFVLCKDKFDFISVSKTNIYPISGGLTISSGLNDILKEGEILIDDGVMNVKRILDEIKNGFSKYKFFDLLNCSGGCIGGPEVTNKSCSIEERASKVKDFREFRKKEVEECNDCDMVVKGVNLGQDFND